MIRHALCVLVLAVAVLSLSLSKFGHDEFTANPQYFEKVINDHMIINGTDAPPGKYPSQLSLRWFGTHTCGGSILNENWGMTAAHCVEGETADQWQVYVGSVDLYGGGLTFGVSKFVVHGSYNSNNQFINDIALIKFRDPLPFGDNIKAVSLPSQSQDTEGGTIATVIGWGYSYPDGDVVQMLQEVDIFVVSDPDCESIHGGKPHPSNICAGVPEGGKGPCNFDYGGPLFVNGQQVGIVSWAVTPCTVPPYPGVYTEVSHYVDWIAINQN